MNKNKIIRPWKKNFKAFFVLLCIAPFLGEAQNIIEKQLSADNIETISIDGNQIFSISIKTTKKNQISLKSTLDGEYQNEFQVVVKQEKNILKLKLEEQAFTKIADDKRNAHKVIAASLYLEIPEQLNLNILSDIGSVNAVGDFNTVSIELIQGYCSIKGFAKNATINTIDGKIDVFTKDAKIMALSSNGNVVTDEFNKANSIWKLKSINGDITVVKQE